MPQTADQSADPSRTTAPAIPAAGSPAPPVAGLLAAGILLIAMNLRPGVVAVSPELDAIRASTGLSGSMAGLLTTLPILCFGILAPFAAKLARRIGMTRALGAMMLLLTAGIALRLAPGLPALFAGTALIGAAISLSNVLVPSIIKRHFHRHTGLMMGLYSVALFCGAALAAGVTVPLGDALGLGWRGAIGVWAVLSALALLLWVPQLRRPDAPPATTAAVPTARTPLRRSPLAWQVTLTMGLQSLQYYACAAWIPAMLTSEGMSSTEAGWMLSLMSLVGIAGSLVFTALVGRLRNQVPFAVVGTLLFLGSLIGLIVAPVGGAYAWMLMQGFGSGLLISTALAVIVLRSPDAARAAEMSGMAQGVGYLLAAAGPFLLGALHDATGGWTVPLTLLAVLCVPMGIAGVGAGRVRHLDA
ncbi:MULTISPECIES: MFS transporter [unclassified Streptomyces]|uniref:CynX/NimT family MFS transporter n=1 Tax=unclassified Streptomyces TaxID=2593676 RepID=UPI000DB9E348|nr:MULTISPECIES: MFS transporter [unclassified Streptomyces]MYT74419.1 MFS transporter [Streptomyces sp. SID8367]RAJ91397.1 CP family cyanate transporter-like MFS transporter [Streptomyces sp. PsTaAH-137]